MREIKPFEEVRPEDIGKDYHDCVGKVIATGTYDQLKQYDSTGACYDLEEDERQQMVAVLDSEGETLLYVYGPDGFSVSKDIFNPFSKEFLKP